MLLVPRLLIALACVCATPAFASRLEFQPAELPPEIKRLNAVALTADGEEFIMTGLAADGSCAVGVLNEHFAVVALRFFPLSFPNTCRFAGSDSAGNIIITGKSESQGFPVTYQLQPDTPGRNFVIKLTRLLEVIFTTRFECGVVLATAVAKDGSIWVGGYARFGVPTTGDALQSTYFVGFYVANARDRSAFVVRISSDGQRILYATYLGSLRDAVGAISIDRDGSVYVSGSRIWKLSSSGRLIWSTWVPPAAAFASAIGPTGDLYLVGTTEGLGMYTTASSFQSNPLPGQVEFGAGSVVAYPQIAFDGFALRITAEGQLVYSTLMGGIRSDSLSAIRVENDGSAYVLGFSNGNLFPTRSAVATGRGTVFAKLSADGSMVEFSTYLAEGSDSFLRLPDGANLILYYCRLPDQLTCAYRVTEVPDSSPRIDAVVNSAQARDNLFTGTNATISGEGFSLVTAVTVGDVPARVVSQSDCLLEIEIPPTLPGVTPQTSFPFDVRLLRDGEVLRQIRVRVYPR